MYPLVRIAIDRGGTFTDIYAQIVRPNDDDPSKPNIEEHVLKLLSEDPQNYQDAPTEGIRRVLRLATSDLFPPGEPIDTKHIHSIRMGTTIATNALLERKGQPCAFVTTMGLKNLLEIGNQSRPDLFDLKVSKPSVLYEKVLEAHERVILDKTTTPPTIKVRTKLDEERLIKDLQKVRQSGISSLAVALMHSYMFPEHERQVRKIALSLGFTNVSLSSELTPMVKIVPRGFTATVDAYLTPKLRDYVSKFKHAFADNLQQTDVQFMQSDGGLCDIDSFFGFISILSGPAGGVVGYARTAYKFEKKAPEASESVAPLPVIGFDMGGTSTDVSRYAGRFEHVFETSTAGVTIQAPQLDVNTVAAGGGSRLFFRTGLFYVGPESAGAHPGPVCYRKGGHLTVTDANLLLGRIEPALFPHIFGPNADQPLDVDATRAAFDSLTAEINQHMREAGEAEMTPEIVADGFIRVANETMCRPIRQLTEAKGHDVRDHCLACFGGAGGQHACEIARSLGISTVFIHRFSGVLSAYGIALADSVVEAQEPVDVPYESEDGRANALSMVKALRKKCEDTLHSRRFEDSDITYELYLHLRYDGTDFGIMVLCPSQMNERLDEVDFAQLFTTEYAREHGFSIPSRTIVIDDVRVRALGTARSIEVLDDDVKLPSIQKDGNGNVVKIIGSATPAMNSKCFSKEAGGWVPMEVWRIHDLPRGEAVLPGPCMIVDSEVGNTVVVDPGCLGRIASDGNILINVAQFSANADDSKKSVEAQHVDPIKLSIYSNRFMGIAEQMGRTLQRTSISTNIKERLDFSCALFDETGGLVANAPHVPVHLGAMQDAVRYQIRTLGEDWHKGEVILSNHPQAGGSHLPDITVITPVYHEDRVVFYVASRGHHADIGGITPGSMPPFSKLLSDEGVAIRSMKIVKDGLFQEDDILQRLQDAGCRCIRDVISDLRAQVAANQKGIVLVSELISMQGLNPVISYMHHIQNAAAQAVRHMLRTIASNQKALNNDGSQFTTVEFKDAMDDGTMIKLKLTIDETNGSAVFNFEGTGKEVEGNTNAPPAVTSSAIIYALRCLVNEEIPLNQGCIEPIKTVVPEGSILRPSADVAVVGGNVLTSQRVTDVVLGAFGACAASQGCMNNLTFGDATMGYYETLGGGAGAGKGWNGSSGVQTHMTNTRITDAEILERRYPVIVQQFHLREGSGGKGQWNGGDGLVRALEFTKPMTVSLLTERRTMRPWGLQGGADGLAGHNQVRRADGTVQDIGGKGSFDVNHGDVVSVRTPGGGGYGTVAT